MEAEKLDVYQTTKLMHIYINIRDCLNVFIYRMDNGNFACFSHVKIIFRGISLFDRMLAYRKAHNGYRRLKEIVEQVI